MGCNKLWGDFLGHLQIHQYHTREQKCSKISFKKLSICVFYLLNEQQSSNLLSSEHFDLSNLFFFRQGLIICFDTQKQFLQQWEFSLD